MTHALYFTSETQTGKKEDRESVFPHCVCPNAAVLLLNVCVCVTLVFSTYIAPPSGAHRQLHTEDMLGTAY